MTVGDGYSNIHVFISITGLSIHIVMLVVLAPYTHRLISILRSWPWQLWRYVCDHDLLGSKRKSSDTGNRTPGYRVTQLASSPMRGDNVSHYTISDERTKAMVNLDSHDHNSWVFGWEAVAKQMRYHIWMSSFLFWSSVHSLNSGCYQILSLLYSTSLTVFVY